MQTTEQGKTEMQSRIKENYRRGGDGGGGGGEQGKWSTENTVDCKVGRYEYVQKASNELKVRKHEIILNFFLPKSNPYTPFVNFRKKFRFFSFDFRQNFDVRTFPR
jgi:hypothetical protein